MKRFYIPFLLVAAAAVAACNVKVDIEEPADGSYIYTLNASAPDVETKTDYDSEGTFSWSAGDAISVLFHNGETNKFFTLTTTGSGANATFSGTIDSGYTVGASDGTSEDLKIWALFPASDNHEYTSGSNPNFYVQPSVDFTTSHFSANIPMYALNAAEGSMSFLNLASTYKFIVKNIKAGVDKVTFRIHNQTTYGLSGSWPIHADLYLKYDYASPGSAKSTLTYTSAVTSNQAVFYVSCRYWGNFQPIITVTNANTGIDIKTFTATKVLQPTYKNKIQPVNLDVSEANGGNYFTPAITVDGNLSDWASIAALPSSQNSRIREWKFEQDEYNLYFYFSLRKNRVGSKPLVIGFNTDNDTTTGSNYDTNKILGNEVTVIAYPFTGDNTSPVAVQGYDSSSSISINGGSTYNGLVYVWDYDDGSSISSDSSNIYIELSIPRDKLNLPASGNSITVGCAFDYYVTGTQSLTLE